MKRIWIFLLLGYLGSCKNTVDPTYVKSKSWRYQEGFIVGDGDFIIFKPSKFFYLQGDTLYYKNAARAIIQSVNKSDQTMVVSSLDRTKKGTYAVIDDTFK